MIRYLDSHLISVNDPQELRNLLLPLFLQAYGNRLLAVFLYGSRARGQYRSNSDLDLMIILTGSARSKVERIREVPVPQDYKGPPVSPVVLTVEEFRRFPPITRALLDGHVVWYSAEDSGGGAGTGTSGQDMAEIAEIPDGATTAGASWAQRLLGELQRFMAEQKIERVRFRGGYYWRRRESPGAPIPPE